MRSRFFCAVVGAAYLAAAMICASVQAAERTPGRLKILTWNIQMLPTFPDVEPLRKMQAVRAPWIVDFLNDQDYDIVVLQEVIDHKMTALLKDGLKAKYPYIVSADGKLGFSACSGGNLIAAKIPLKYIAHIVFQNTSGVDTMAEKGCLLVEAELDGFRFQVAGTHMQAGDPKTRVKQVPEIDEGILAPHTTDGVPQLLAGDMNTNFGEPDYRDFLRITQMRDFEIDDPSPFTTDGQNSWNRKGKQPKRIDHVLLNPRGTATTIVRQRVQRARREHDGRTIDLSNHYGVVAEVQLRK